MCTVAKVGNLDAVYLACYAIGQFVWGTFADRWGPRVVVLGGLAMSAVAATFMGFTTAALFSVGERGRVLGLWSTNYAFGWRAQYGIALRDPMVRTLGISYFLLKPECSPHVWDFYTSWHSARIAY